jgi:hypothetical protein
VIDIPGVITTLRFFFAFWAEFDCNRDVTPTEDPLCGHPKVVIIS